MNAMIILAVKGHIEVNNSMGYIIGTTLALFILVYLFYSLAKPEKF
jgi:K+-transporting ATPase KdpF subunit